MKRKIIIGTTLSVFLMLSLAWITPAQINAVDSNKRDLDFKKLIEFTSSSEFKRLLEEQDELTELYNKLYRLSEALENKDRYSVKLIKNEIKTYIEESSLGIILAEISGSYSNTIKDGDPSDDIVKTNPIITQNYYLQIIDGELKCSKGEINKPSNEYLVIKTDSSAEIHCDGMILDKSELENILKISFSDFEELYNLLIDIFAPLSWISCISACISILFGKEVLAGFFIILDIIFMIPWTLGLILKGLDRRGLTKTKQGYYHSKNSALNKLFSRVINFKLYKNFGSKLKMFFRNFEFSYSK